MNDAVNRVIIERGAMERGLPGSVALSTIGHAFILGVCLAVPYLLPAEPLLKVQDGFAVAVPLGGGGTPAAAAAAAQTQVQPPEPAPQAPEPPPKIAKPPKEEPNPKALPELDAKKGKPKNEKPAPSRSVAGGATQAGPSTQTPGIDFGPAGPGAPGGTDPFGDWYLAGVQRKIWMLWAQQVKSGFTQPIGVTFTIIADGSLADVRVTQPSGVALLDLAAQRAIYAAGPFGPLPKDYGTNRYTIQAIFKPTP